MSEQHETGQPTAEAPLEREPRREIDETTLKRIADITGGMFFRARDTEGLSEIYERINKLEKSEVKVKEYRSYNELFPVFLIPALLLLLLEIFLRRTVLLKVP